MNFKIDHLFPFKKSIFFYKKIIKKNNLNICLLNSILKKIFADYPYFYFLKV